MIKAKITKNIMGKGTVAGNLTWRQIIFGVAGVLVGFGVLALGWGKMNINLLMSLVFIVIVVTILLGVVRINGMSFLKFMLIGFKGVDKRPYCTKGGFHDED
jgi:type IV secretory pathway VirB3-like protein